MERRSSDREHAIREATRALMDLGRDPARYELDVEETDDAWKLSFSGKQPRAPGDDVSVVVDKRSGALHTMLGE